MTVTISRLYDNYFDAQRAVTSLEAAGVPHSDLSIVANNSDDWYSTDTKVDRDRDGSTIVPKARLREQASAQVSVARLVCSPASACWPFPA